MNLWHRLWFQSFHIWILCLVSRVRKCQKRLDVNSSLTWDIQCWDFWSYDWQLARACIVSLLPSEYICKVLGAWHVVVLGKREKGWKPESNKYSYPKECFLRALSWRNNQMQTPIFNKSHSHGVGSEHRLSNVLVPKWSRQFPMPFGIWNIDFVTPKPD